MVCGREGVQGKTSESDGSTQVRGSPGGGLQRVRGEGWREEVRWRRKGSEGARAVLYKLRASPVRGWPRRGEERQNGE